MQSFISGRDLTKADFLNMLEIGTVDTGSGTLFGGSQKRAVDTNKLTLIIGIGGSGIAALLKTFNIANQKLEPGYSAYTKFLAVDTSETELEPLSHKGIDTLNISSPRAQVRLNYDNRQFHRRFIDRDFPIQLLAPEGASQVRQIAKVKLYDQNGGTTNDMLLRDKINRYFYEDWRALQSERVNILILTGITGGTGSGIFIDVAARAKQACPRPANVTVYGYIMMPDTVERFAPSHVHRMTLYRNGYAALKELESFESIPMETGRKESIFSSNPYNNIELTNANIPFDYPVLVSGDYDEATLTIAETIVNSMNTDSNTYYNQDSFYSNSATMRMQVIANNVISHHGILNVYACPEDSRMYSSIGYVRASIPEKIVIPHVIGTVSRRLYEPNVNGTNVAATNFTGTCFCTKDKSLNRQDYEKAMRELLGLKQEQELRESSLWNKLNAKMNSLCSLRDNHVEISYDDVVCGNTRHYFEGFRVNENINNAINRMELTIENEIELLKHNAQGVMRKYGPRAMQYLYNGTGNINEHGGSEHFVEYCLKTQIDYVMNGFLAQRAGVMPRRPEPIKSLFGRFEENLSHKKLTEWKEAVKAYEIQNIRYAVSKNMTGENGIWHSSFVIPLMDFIWSISRFADVLETVSEYYDSVGSSLNTDDYWTFANQRGCANEVNLCSNREVYTWVKEKINNKLASIEIQDVRDYLINDFYENTQVWTSNEAGVAREHYDEVMSMSCQVGKNAQANNGLELTIVDYFNHVAEKTTNSDVQGEIKNTVDFLFEQLLTRSRPCLEKKQGTIQKSYRAIILPRTLDAIEAGPIIKKEFTKKFYNSDQDVPIFMYSLDVDSILFYQTSVAEALSDIKNIELWENAYEQLVDKTTHLHSGEIPTLHMDTGYSQYNELTMDETIKEAHLEENRRVYPTWANDNNAMEELNKIYGTGLSWLHYPSINVARYGNSFNSNDTTFESEYRRNMFSKKIDEALRIGVIECERTGDVYKYFINLIPRDWKNLQINEYKKRHHNGMFVRGKELFDYLASLNRDSYSSYRKQICLQNSFIFGPNGFDFTEIKEAEHWTQERIDREHKNYMMRIMRKSTALFQDMEDTMFKLYPIEFSLEVKEMKVIAFAAYSVFFKMYMFGVVNSNEKGDEWAAIVDEEGNTEILARFTRSRLRSLGDLDIKLITENLRLFYVYKQYSEVRNEFSLSDERLDSILSKVNRKISDKELDEFVEVRTKKLAEELILYKEKFGYEEDPLEEIMSSFELDVSLMEEVQSIVDFYETLDKTLNSLDAF